ncbi:MAG: TIGR03084 family metal-binding protein [Ilumatobacter sp.]|uniref:TIGR03084 family metal-binding protein n=1 Tax=Ilumatobacter sp. TaxID=1967498 RepID=UPI003C728DE9
MTTNVSSTGPTAASVRQDLIDEQDALDRVVAGFDADAWSRPTASDRWSVADQIGHLTFFDGTAALAIADEDGFRASMAGLAPVFAPDATPDTMDDLTLGSFRRMTPPDLLDAWRTNRSVLADAASGLADDARVVWYGPSMGAKSFLTARLMECWAHGQHIVDAVGATRESTDRLQHIAQLGFITRKWTYINRGMDAPTADVRVELAAPSGDVWHYGPDDAEQSVTGSAEDFCLVVTQCRHVDATDLTLVGDGARDWMTKAQAFAGGATDGPAAR